MSPKDLESYIIRYKAIYCTVAFILGLTVTIGGDRLGSLNGQYAPESHVEVTGWMLHIFGCAILYNSNNMWPSIWLMLIGLFTIFIGLFTMLFTKYGIRTNRKVEAQDKLDRKALHSKFKSSMTGLVLGLFLAVLGIVLAENGGNLCPTDWATKIMSYETLDFLYGRYGPLFLAGVTCLIFGIITIITTRYRIRISNKLEEDVTERDPL